MVFLTGQTWLIYWEIKWVRFFFLIAWGGLVSPTFLLLLSP